MSFVQPSTSRLNCRHCGKESLAERRFICGVAVLYFRCAEGGLPRLVCCSPCRDERACWKGKCHGPASIFCPTKFLPMSRVFCRVEVKKFSLMKASDLQIFFHLSVTQEEKGEKLSLKKFLHMTIN